MIIIIDTQLATNEEVKQLTAYLKKHSWDYQAEESDAS